jgi:hypothetical protein
MRYLLIVAMLLVAVTGWIGEIHGGDNMKYDNRLNVITTEHFETGKYLSKAESCIVENNTITGSGVREVIIHLPTTPITIQGNIIQADDQRFRDALEKAKGD